jgi:2-oxo-4-hydroxy-4-carboxy-5-ureidoimidazoline decarboxylase
MQLDDLNALDADAAARELLQCCGSSRWARQMAASRPFASAEELIASADRYWAALDRADWLEAFAAHPRIGAAGVDGADRAGADQRHAKALAERGAAQDWSAQEQAGVGGAADATLLRFANLNRDYEARFGYIFIVCATGKSAAEMLDLLERRIWHDPETEIRLAGGEQRKIMQLRLMKLLDGRQD